MSTQRPTLIINSTVMRSLFVAAALQGCDLQRSDQTLQIEPGSSAELETGQGPDGVVIEDLDGDGLLDIAANNFQSANIAVFLNKGVSGNSLQFGLKHYAAGDAPTNLAAGDLDQDGDIDLVTQNFAEGKVKVLFNNGSGRFYNKSSFEVGSVLLSVAVGDIDGDGYLDIASTGSGDGLAANENTTYGIFVLYGTGNGDFSPVVAYALTNPAYSVALGDLNGDGLLDMANSDTAEASVSVHINQGERSFAPRAIYETGDTPYGVTIADLNGDGAAEVISTITNASVDHSEVEPDFVVVLQNDGAGNFATQTLHQAGNHPFAVAAVDLNGDGLLDLAATNSSAENSSFFLNQGGSFSAEMTLPVGSNPFAIASGDLDGSGAVDIVVANRFSGTLSVLFNSFASSNTGQ
jgi:hypothetical protein